MSLGKSRDSIALAFSESNYATPYTDNSIPGCTPGHRVMRLGRQHCPVPNQSQLTHALTAPYVQGVTEGEGNGCSYQLLQTGLAGRSVYRPGGPTRDDYLHSENYILNSKNCGRRHYDEERGMEAQYRPSYRLLDTPVGDTRAPVRKGVGVYNYGCGTTYGLHPDAINAREMRAKAELDKKKQSKAIVAGPSDHSMIELGLCHYMSGAKYSYKRSTQERREHSAASGALPPINVASPPSPAPTQMPEGKTSGAGTQYRCSTTDELPIALGLTFNSPSMNERSGIGARPYLSGVRPSQDAPDYLVERQMRSERRAAAQSNAVANDRREEVMAVRRLPDWGDEKAGVYS